MTLRVKSKKFMGPYIAVHGGMPKNDSRNECDASRRKTSGYAPMTTATRNEGKQSSPMNTVKSNT